MAEIRLDDDAAYLRRLAAAGRAGQPLGGLLLAAFGLFVGLGAAAMWGGNIDLATGLLAGLVVFAAVACGDAVVARRRLILAAGASALTVLAVWTFYALGLWVALHVMGPGPLGFANNPILWALYSVLPVTLALGLIGAAVYILIRMRRHPAAMAPGNVVAGALWSGGVLLMAAILAAFVLAGITMEMRLEAAAARQAGAGDSPVDIAQISINSARMTLFALIPGMFWLIWALAWWVWGLAAGRRWALGVAGGSLAVAIWYIATFAVFPTSIAGLLLLAFVPGLILIREARQQHGWG